MAKKKKVFNASEAIKASKGSGSDRLLVPRPQGRHGSKKGKKGYDRKKGKSIPDE